MKRAELILSVRVEPTGDRASAEDPEAICTAARWLLREARAAGAGDPRAAFYCEGSLVRADVSRAGL